MEGPQGTKAFLGIGQEASPPSGEEDDDLKAAMLKEASATSFRFRVNVWCRKTGRGQFDWATFQTRLEAAEFRGFAGNREALQSLGWFGRGNKGNWLFGVAGYRIPLFGKSAMRHELFHAAQDLRTGLLDQNPGLLQSLAAEYSAHLWGGPLLGVPIAYGGSLLIICCVFYLFVVLTGLM